jgi:hypothetical protein
MKIVRMLHFATLLFIFAPFFQMCESKSEPVLSEPGPQTGGVVHDTHDTVQTTKPHETEALPADESGDNTFQLSEIFTVTGPNQKGYEVVLFLILMIVDGSWSDLDLPTSLTACSIILSLVGGVLLIRSRLRWLRKLSLVNSLFIIAAFVAALAEFDKPGFIKWGFYAYAILLIITTILLFNKTGGKNRGPSFG